MRIQTYELVEKDGEPGILCLVCDMTSHHPADIDQKYCARCGQFHEAVARRIEAGMRRLAKGDQARRVLRRLGGR